MKIKGIEETARGFGWTTNETGEGVCRVCWGEMEHACSWQEAVALSQRLDLLGHGSVDPEGLYVQETGYGTVKSGPHEQMSEIQLAKIGFDNGHQVLTGAELLLQARMARVPLAELAALGASCRIVPEFSALDDEELLTAFRRSSTIGQMHLKAVTALVHAGRREREAMMELVRDAAERPEGVLNPWLSGDLVAVPDRRLVSAKGLDAVALTKAIPDGDGPHGVGFRDAIESMVLALRSRGVSVDVVNDALQEVLDAYANNEQDNVSELEPDLEFCLSAQQDAELDRLARQFDYAKAVRGLLRPVEQRAPALGSGLENVYVLDSDDVRCACKAIQQDREGLMAGASVSLKKKFAELFAEAGISNDFAVSVSYEAWSPEARALGETDDRGFIVEGEKWDDDELAKNARRYGFTEVSQGLLRPDTTGVLFLSGAPDEDADYFGRGIEKSYTLKVSSVNGRVPTGHDFQYLADVLGARFANRLECSAANIERALSL